MLPCKLSLAPRTASHWSLSRFPDLKVTATTDLTPLCSQRAGMGLWAILLQMLGYE